jgi:hypothetical protein
MSTILAGERDYGCMVPLSGEPLPTRRNLLNRCPISGTFNYARRSEA